MAGQAYLQINEKEWLVSLAVDTWELEQGLGGLPELAAHDLRRSYAQIGYDSGIPITQISILLGHSSVAVTQRYLNLDLDLECTASDFVPFG